MRKPLIGVTIGDPAGIGPEIVAKTLMREAVLARCQPVVIGHTRFFQRDVPGFPAFCRARGIPIIDVESEGFEGIAPGVGDAAAGLASFAYVTRAIDLAKQGRLEAVATAPITKSALVQAGVPFKDHTEMFEAAFPGQAMTLLGNPRLKVVHVMRHASLRRSVLDLTEEKILETIRVTHEVMQKAYRRLPRILVAGLNPHNGDEGLMGDEESTLIAPAVAAARALGIDAHGPIPADSVFPKAMDGGADVVVSMYHDQGHIAIKASDWRRSYGLTLGLSIVRSSADHGSALDIAGKGIAHAESMTAAMEVLFEVLGTGK